MYMIRLKHILNERESNNDAFIDSLRVLSALADKMISDADGVFAQIQIDDADAKTTIETNIKVMLEAVKQYIDNPDAVNYDDKGIIQLMQDPEYADKMTPSGAASENARIILYTNIQGQLE